MFLGTSIPLLPSYVTFNNFAGVWRTLSTHPGVSLTSQREAPGTVRGRGAIKFLLMLMCSAKYLQCRNCFSKINLLNFSLACVTNIKFLQCRSANSFCVIKSLKWPKRLRLFNLPGYQNTFCHSEERIFNSDIQFSAHEIAWSTSCISLLENLTLIKLSKTFH